MSIIACYSPSCFSYMHFLHSISSKNWNPLISIYPVSYVMPMVFRHAEFGTDLWLERSSEYFRKKLKYIWKCMYMQDHAKRFPECTEDEWGGPWQRKQGNGIGWGWQGHLATDFSSCCWNHYSCFSSQSWDLGALWASLSDFWVCVRDCGVLFMTIWSNTSGPYPHMWISENTISEAHKLGGIRLAKCTL